MDTLQSIFTWTAITCGVGVFVIVVDALAYAGSEIWHEWRMSEDMRKEKHDDN
jgi:hypothetical protein